MKILTLNTHSWLEANQRDKIKAIAKEIINNEYDLIALQEVNQLIQSAELEQITAYGGQSTLHEDNFALLLQREIEGLGQKYYFTYHIAHRGFNKYQEGLSFLVKTPIIELAEIITTPFNDFEFLTRKAIRLKTKIAGQSYTFYNCHASWWANGFPDEWHRLITDIESQSGPIILMGDFNAPDDIKDESYHLISNHFQDSFHEAREKIGRNTITESIAGWVNNTQARRIDFVFYNSLLTAKSYEVVFDNHRTPIVSDHFGVSVEIEHL
ncbi:MULTISPECIES: endonuclease/exonuclease/phosphatase family protein [unclassified Enterococcus]|uniref:endonuclease/exonuclease/phosphatase family protein n=1 Tax=unclassified Enterococcus TaxID=2608891 RepID=UPI001551B937|nr:MULTISPECIES: endonuclease/exonuclease/phosphatase family protein [unclassified Enterococcus]MBS7577189.1 endonuclease/exonuclease/phosphatase family protein [Enterococcus sp. MMGLQ5-2]MBS7584718.1 endonuclease/exonuclease/phosphatase family protein [Enterococcus sp. MMGLQ5-1]NPD12573.1 endonuclease/exonuclease/phosphatase family protein [Enterococcus sp. MMGLQ5-1]NPD37023.1 endonuclease/exonuclease/phosphatase family protein [Enterococcus sp. MMGLQ5-2]